MKKLSLALIPVFLLLDIALFAQQVIPMDQFIGVNVRREDPVNRMKAFGFVREYHEWSIDEGYLALQNGEAASPGYPNNLYKFNYGYQNQTFIQFDNFYQDMQAEGLMLAPCLFKSIPYIINPDLLPSDADAIPQLEQAPVYPGDDHLDPASYVAYADWLYHYTARNGHHVFSPAMRDAIIAPKIHPAETVKTGAAYVDYVEVWNEQDKYWITDYPTTFFEPEEYAAMLSAAYDGHNQTLSLEPDPDNPGQLISTVGICNADPNMKVITGGLSDLDMEYFEGMMDWFEANRDTSKIYPFDVINLHHYANDALLFNQLGNVGVSPEEDDLKELLQDFVNLRDNHFPDAELWLSEFGYDTNEQSLQRVPTNGVGSYSQEEVQGQWMVRSFLEIAAAGFDRAVAFDLRDECTDGYCEGTFVSSGLVTSLLDNWSPKVSWYYIYTMKNVLEGMVYDSELSPCQDTICAVDCPRVYKFVDPNNAAKEIYAIWSPTSCDKPTYDYPLNLNGLDSATLISLHAPSTIGQQSLLLGQTVMVPVSEQPVFVVVGESYEEVIVDCVTNITASDQSCSSVSLTWESNQSGLCEIRYAEGQLDPATFYVPGATLAIDEFSLVNNGFLVSGLTAETDYTFFITVDNGNGNISETCFIHTQTNDLDCKIQIDPSWVFASSPANDTDIFLFDEQDVVDPICAGGVAPETFWGQDFVFNDAASLSVDLQEYYLLDLIYLYDYTGIGEFTVEYASSPNGPWNNLISYNTVAYAKWVAISNLSTENIPVRYLRFNGDPFDNGAIGEVVLCGNVSDFDDSTLPPGIVSNFSPSLVTCDAIDLIWNAPLDDDLDFYELHYLNGTNEVLQIPATAFNMSATIPDLDPETTYEFFIHCVDMDGNSSDTISLQVTTPTILECENDCGKGCPCEICLQESWITDQTVSPGLDPTRLVDEQLTVNPICGTDEQSPTTEWGADWDPNNDVPPAIAILDLQECYLLSSIHLYDGNGIDTFVVEYQNPDGDWIVIEEYVTESYNQWVVLDDLNINCRFLRFQKRDNEAQINEISICGFPEDCASATCPLEGQNCDDGELCTINDTYDVDCNCIGIDLPDVDGDQICDAIDNCITEPNPNQADLDDDGIGDSCDPCDDTLIGTSCDDNDPCTINDIINNNCLCVGDLIQDSDTDGVCDSLDNCLALFNPGQSDIDGDGLGDVCDSCNNNQTGSSCDDGDICTSNDSIDINCNCVGIFLDTDIDGICDSLDNCINIANPNQEDTDLDGLGDACDLCNETLAGTPCDDGDICTVNDTLDIDCNCAGFFSDVDTDGICDSLDNCIDVANSNQEDADNDGIGDVCDPCDGTLAGTLCDDGDICTNNDTLDINCNCAGIFIDTDTDGVCDSLDNCITDFNPDQSDLDNDGIGDLCDACDATLPGTLCDDGDVCTHSDTLDINCNCVGIMIADSDFDGICDSLDNCINQANSDQFDSDGDGIGNACDSCNGTLLGTPCDDGIDCTINDALDINCTCVGILVVDTDTDGICDSLDNCITEINSNQEDIDSDGIGDACDPCDDNLIGTACDDGIICTINDTYDADCNCIGTALPDSDGDGICDSIDNCPNDANPNQLDLDNDGIGNECDPCDGLFSGAGEPCDDGDICTVNDVYDILCSCAGEFVDTDNDGVCDSLDLCVGFDDNIDLNNNGVPDNCDSLVMHCSANQIENSCQSQQVIDSLFGEWISGFYVVGGCNPQTSVLNVAPPSACGGATQVNFVVSDDCGFLDSCSHHFTVLLNNDPLVITCAMDTTATFLTQQDVDLAFADWITGFTVSGGCSPVINGLDVAPPLITDADIIVTLEVDDMCFGMQTCNATFKLDPCSTPTGLALSNITSTSIEATWDAVPLALGYKVIYREVLSGNAGVWQEAFTSNNGFVAIDLDPATTYSFRVFSDCVDGLSPVSDYVTGSTLPCPIPQNLSLVTVDQFEVELTWDMAGDGDYKLIYREVLPDGSGIWIEMFPSSNQFTVLNLLPNTKYVFRVFAQCDGAFSEVSDYLIATTEACDTPANLSVQSVDIDEIAVTWDATNSTAYKLIYREVLPNGAGIWQTVYPTTNGYLVQGLNASTQYAFRIFSDCDGTFSPVSNYITAFTSGCLTPSNLNVISVAETNITVGWDAVTTASDYKVIYREVLPNDAGVWQEVFTTGTNLAISGLTPGKQYTFRVFSQCGTTLSPVSNYVTAWTLSTPCPTPTNLFLVNVTDVSIDAVWDAMPDADSYKLIYREVLPNNGGVWQEAFPTTTIYTIFGLQPQTEYTVRVFSVCNGLLSPVSSYVTAFTEFPALKGTISDEEVALDFENNRQDFNEKKYSVSAFPNPANQFISLVFKNWKTGKVAIEIYDTIGNTVLKAQQELTESNQLKIHFKEGYSDGLYFVRVKNEDQIFTFPIVIQQ